MSSLPSWDADASGPHRLSFKIVRAFKALDDGKRHKWVLVVRLQDLPATFPLDANARVPNVLKNKTCSEMRATLLTQPEMFQVFNGGVVCTAQDLRVRQVENAMFADVEFDASGGQGIVNGGHSYTPRASRWARWLRPMLKAKTSRQRPRRGRSQGPDRGAEPCRESTASCRADIEVEAGCVYSN